MTGPPLYTYGIKWFKTFHSHSVFLKLFIPTALKARTGNYNAGTQPITPHFSPRQYPKWKRNVDAVSNSVRSQQKKGSNKGVMGARHSTRRGDQHLPGKEVWGTKGPDVKPLRGTTRLSQPSNESADNPAESSRNPARERKPLKNPQAPPSQPPTSGWVPISDSQTQFLYSPHSGGSSRSVATWRTVPLF